VAANRERPFLKFSELIEWVPNPGNNLTGAFLTAYAKQLYFSNKHIFWQSPLNTSRVLVQGWDSSSSGWTIVSNVTIATGPALLRPRSPFCWTLSLLCRPIEIVFRSRNQCFA